jgi:hypothetical protein
MGFIPAETINAMRGKFKLGVFLYIGTATPIRLWWGVAGTLARLPSVDSAPTKYIGAGRLLETPDALEVLFNGASDRVEFNLDGVDADLVERLAETSPRVLGSRVIFGYAPMDDFWQARGNIVEAWDGTAECWAHTIVYPEVRGEPASATMTLITSAGSVARSSTPMSTWTDRVQQGIARGLGNPIDLFCENVSRYYQTRHVRWPLAS